MYRKKAEQRTPPPQIITGRAQFKCNRYETMKHEIFNRILFVRFYSSLLFIDFEVNGCFSTQVTPRTAVFTHIFKKILKQFYGTSSCRSLPQKIVQNILNTSWVHLSSKIKRNTYLRIFHCQISLLFWCCPARWRRLFKTISLLP